MYWAAEHGKVECLRLLLRSGADKEARGKASRAPLHAAAAHHASADGVRALVEAGALKEPKDQVRAYRYDRSTAAPAAAPHTLRYLPCSAARRHCTWRVRGVAPTACARSSPSEQTSTQGQT